jgi:hypothetical protein
MDMLYEHSKRYVEDLRTNSEALLKQYILKIRENFAAVDQGKVAAAIYGYLYALGNMGMVECAEDGITPLCIKPEYKETDHYKDNKDARVCARYVSDYLKQPDNPHIYAGMVYGVKKLMTAPYRNTMERELAGYLGAVTFEIGLVREDPFILEKAIRAINNVPTERTRIRLREEIRRSGANRMGQFTQLEADLARDDQQFRQL